jgi:3D (Asp-Asp-Asp) domain-containing protein
MKIKKIAASILTVTTLALMGISTQTQTVNAAVASIDTSSVIYITNNNGAQLYSLSNDTMSTTSRSLANKSAWITNKITNVNGVTYYQVATNTWVAATDLSTEAPAVSLDKDMYVKNNGGVNLYDAPNGNYVGSVNGGSTVHVYESKTDANGTTWYDVGKSRWINGEYLSNDNVKQTLTMSATAYDPAVLGSSMGYSGVAANLSKFPKGTHLRITDGNGNTYDRVVNDTGLFAYSNPNQLDIAMPNSQALQFGRQNVTVQVIG